jgi:hypothetical protein
LDGRIVIVPSIVIVIDLLAIERRQASFDIAEED